MILCAHRMKPTEAEFEELRARVARLEARLGVTAPEPATGGEPPVMAPPTVSAPTSVVRPAVARPAPRKEFNATTWIAGTGVVIFLLGAIYGLKVAIQQGWISPPVRVLLGLAAGVGFAVGAVRQFRTSRPLGVALLAAGAGLWTFTFYYGVRGAHLFPHAVGLAGAAVAVLGCGAVAARRASDGAMAVSLATGLVAPLALAKGWDRFSELLVYLTALSGAQCAVHYLSRVGANWRISRLLGTAGIWFLALVGANDMYRGDSASVLALMAVLGAVGLVAVWLPRHPGQPWAPGTGAAITLIGLAWAAWPVWDKADMSRESFSVVLALLGAASLALVRPARRRTESAAHDRPLFLLGAGFALVAVPVALEWKWVVIAWGVAALVLARLARAAVTEERTGAENTLLIAVLVSIGATCVWLALALDQGEADAMFLNRVFTGAALAAGAWCLLVLTPGAQRGPAFALLQFTAVNAVAWELSRALPVIRGEGSSLALGALLATLVYAVAGAGLWLRGMLAGDAKWSSGLRKAGYAWLAVAVVKLLFHDLAGRDLIFRALAALGVGAILIAAALWANHRRKVTE